MPFKNLDAGAWNKGLSRILIVGGPNMRKTSSLLTWPRPTAIMSYPGEKGYASIPADLGDVDGFVWEEDAATKLSASAVVKDIEQTTFSILKAGKYTTFAGDGLHKLYGAYLNDATNGAYAAGDDFEARLYSRAHEAFLHYLNRVMASPIPYVVFTVWDGREADVEGAKGGTSHVYPDLPGKLAKRIMGEFSVVLYAEVSPPQPGQPQTATWQLQPGGKVWGAGVKVPVQIASKLPVKVPQDWRQLEPLLLGQTPNKAA